MAKKQWIKQSALTVFEHGATRVLDAILTLCLIRIMSSSEFGLFSVYQGQVGLLFLMLPALEDTFYRNYSRLKSENRLADELSTLKLFAYFKVAVCIVFVALFFEKLSLMALAVAIPLSQASYGLMRESLRFELKQSVVTLVSISQKLTAVVIVGIGLARGLELSLVVSAVIVSFALFGFVWRFSAATIEPWQQKAVARPLKARFLEIGKTLWHTVLWLHIMGMAIQIVPSMAPLWLHSRRVAIEEIALYSIALKAANFFQIVPLALMSVFAVYLARTRANARKELQLLGRSSLVFALLGFALFGFGCVIDTPLLSFLGKGKLDDAGLVRTASYFRWQLAGVVVLSMTYPLATYLTARLSVWRLCVFVYATWALLSAALFYYATLKPWRKFFLKLLYARSLSDEAAIQSCFKGFR